MSQEHFKILIPTCPFYLYDLNNSLKFLRLFPQRQKLAKNNKAIWISKQYYKVKLKMDTKAHNFKTLLYSTIIFNPVMTRGSMGHFNSVRIQRLYINE